MSNFFKRQKKTKMAFWVVSNCNPPNKREQYVKALQKYIQIDVFGGCTSSKNLCPHNTKQLKRDVCINQLALEYKFYISFENSDCKEYMTEKYYRTLGQPIIPIVMGLGDYAKDGPPNSSINVNDFTSVKALADYIKLLDRDQVIILKCAKNVSYDTFFRLLKGRLFVIFQMERKFCSLQKITIL
jgi:hypothetical protein